MLRALSQLAMYLSVRGIARAEPLAIGIWTLPDGSESTEKAVEPPRLSVPSSACEGDTRGQRTSIKQPEPLLERERAP